MGCFSYICKHCNENIRADENCTLIHVRHGVQVGLTQGHYNLYGTTYEEQEEEENGVTTTFRSHMQGHINSHAAIWQSEWGLPDSYNAIGKVSITYRYLVCDGTKHIITYEDYKNYKLQQLEVAVINKRIKPEEYAELKRQLHKDIENNTLIYAFNKLPKVPNHVLRQGNTYSGVVAYHTLCYNRALKKGLVNLIPSDKDNNQGCGKARKKFL